ncbi:hypothetical protein ABBQ38_009142 [Trebouxia sp. C0009 RCD-2024]
MATDMNALYHRHMIMHPGFDLKTEWEFKSQCVGLCRGAIQASFFTYLLFLFSTNISKYFGGQDLPDQYTARNITVTIRTAVGGLAYLATFIFGANALGLAGLTLKLAFFPDAVSATSKDANKQTKDETSL